MKTFILFFLSAVCIGLGSCASIPETLVEMVPVTPTKLTSAEILHRVQHTDTPDPPTPVMRLPEVDQDIFTIPNKEVWSGREGDPRPDWKGWGAETFTVAPDGTFWIADTAVYPNRLLHYSTQGELLQEVSLEDRVVYAYDLAVTQDSVWVVDISADQSKVLRYSLDGEFLSGVDIDKRMMMVEDEFVLPGIFNLIPGEGGELMFSGMAGYYELIDAAGEIVAQPMDTLTYFGHTYDVGSYDQATRQLPVFVDGKPFETYPDFVVEAEPFLGFNPDGSFVMTGYAPESEFQVDHQVRYYDSAGNILGVARQYPQTFYKDWNHHLAFGPDGSLYQLLSNLDHSVQILRLGFAEELPPKIAGPAAVPTPLSPLLPTESDMTDEGQARNVLIGFFTDLSNANYEQAVNHFGGQMEDYLRPQLPEETITEYWGYVCAFLWCLPVAEISDTEQVSENEYIFYTVFMMLDGMRFEIGACCGGDPAATPPVWQFAYPVQKIDGEWKVMRAPLFTP